MDKYIVLFVQKHLRILANIEPSYTHGSLRCGRQVQQCVHMLLPQMRLAICTNTFNNWDKYILLFGQIHFRIWANIEPSYTHGSLRCGRQVPPQCGLDAASTNTLNNLHLTIWTQKIGKYELYHGNLWMLRKSGNMSYALEKVENCWISTRCLFFAVLCWFSIFGKQIVRFKINKHSPIKMASSDI